MSFAKQAKDHPIIFSSDMVKAILAGTKTQTHRVIKPQPDIYTYEAVSSTLPHMGNLWDWHRKDKKAPLNPIAFKCPYGTVGSRLWIKETYCFSHDALLCKADYNGTLPLGYKWKSPLFMPRKFSRITLEITNIRVEKLQEITANDCVKEGCDRTLGTNPHYHPRDRFKDLWDSLAKKGFKWKSNCWVWVISFRRVE